MDDYGYLSRNVALTHLAHTLEVRTWIEKCLDAKYL